MVVAYSFDSLAPNSMKSKNPHSGCRAVEVAKTLDTTDPNPCKNQGGIAIVQPMPCTLKIHSGCEGGGKVAFIQEDKSATLATNNDQYLFQPTCIVDSIGGQAERGWVGDVAPCLKASHYKCAPVITQAAGFKPGQGSRARSIGYAEECSPTLASEAGGNSVPSVCVAKPVICLQGNGIDRADTAGCNGKGWKEDTSYTLNTIDRPAVAYLASGKETVGTLMANAGTKLWLGNQEAFSGDYSIIEERETLYIVRRLTPTECARLQGFPDCWGDIDQKDGFTPEEYSFWTNVRNTHAAINGRAVKEYTEAQMLTWYNKLHTDAAEYKLWGNGIALPPALYVMQGIADALGSREEGDEWLI